MKKVVSLIIVVAGLLTVLCACSSSFDVVPAYGEIITDCEGIYILPVEVIGDGKEMKIRALWQNDTDATVVFGNAFSIEYKDGDEWVDVPFDLAVTEEACMLFARQGAEKIYDVGAANLSREGTYRLSATFTVHENIDTVSQGKCSIEFDVTSSLGRKKYAVTVEDEYDGLLEPLEQKYKAGDRVVIKTHLVMDADIDVYVNGQEIEGTLIKGADGRSSHREHYFIMPESDVFIVID